MKYYLYSIDKGLFFDFYFGNPLFVPLEEVSNAIYDSKESLLNCDVLKRMLTDLEDNQLLAYEIKEIIYI